MTEDRLTIADYPLAERRPHSVKSAKGTPLDVISRLKPWLMGEQQWMICGLLRKPYYGKLA